MSREGTHLEGARLRKGKSDGEVFDVAQREGKHAHCFRWNGPSTWDIKKVKIVKVACRQNKVW